MHSFISSWLALELTKMNGVYKRSLHPILFFFDKLQFNKKAKHKTTKEGILPYKQQLNLQEGYP